MTSEELEAARNGLLEELRIRWLTTAPDRAEAVTSWPDLKLGLCRWLAGADFPTCDRDWLHPYDWGHFRGRMARARAAFEQTNGGAAIPHRGSLGESHEEVTGGPKGGRLPPGSTGV